MTGPRPVPGSWPSPLSAARATAGVRGVRAVAHAPDGTPWWSEDRPAEGGRVVLMTEAGPQVPEGFDARTGFHEYGGTCWAPLEDGAVVTSSWTDQRLWLLAPGQPPRALTPASDRRDRWALPGRCPAGLLCLRERLDGNGRRRARHELVHVPLDGGHPTVLWDGSDFVDAPAVSPDGRRWPS